MKFPDLTGAVNFFVSILNFFIGILTFLFRVPLVGMLVIIIVGGLYFYFKYKQTQE